MSVVRRVALMCVGAVIVLAATAAPTFAAAASTTPCGSSCGSDTAITATGTHSPAESCVHDAGCAGGAALMGSSTSALVAVVAGAGVVACALVTRRYRARRAPEPTGTLVAARLFHPPRFALGI